MYPKG